MCLFGRARPAWEEEVSFSNRRHPRHRTRVTETSIRSHHSHSRHRSPSPRPAQYIQASPPTPPSPPVIHHHHPPATIIVAPSTPTPPPMKVELVSVEEDSVRHVKKSRHGDSSRGEEVYIEREREIQRRRPSPVPQMEEQYDTYRYVPGVAPAPVEDYRRRSRGDVGYESGPRVSTGRITERERERVVVNDDRGRGGDGRTREYYRRG